MSKAITEAMVDDLIERLLDAQQDINFAANCKMDQSLCDASALIDEVETFLYSIRSALSAGQAQPGASEPNRFSSPLAGAVRKKVDKELAHLRESVLRSAEETTDPVKSEWPHLIQLCRTLGLFASVIKSGEPWTATCQTEYELANTAAKELYSELNATPAPETPPAVPGEVERQTSYQQIIDLVQDCGCIALPALSAPVPDFTPGIVENTEAGISALVIKDGPTVTGQEMTVRPLLDMETRQIVGFQWDIPFPASPEQGETDA